ncbi:MAG: sugar transferase [Terracidiphilus sp.]|jgi:lipopolysaccharide/colanic/teichoic acid biosynthesis glycosyltransferase
MKRLQEGIGSDGRRAMFMGGMAASGAIYTPAPAELSGAPAISLRHLYVKRTIDIGFSLLVIPVFLLPGLFIAAAILLTSQGAIFYREERIGRNGRAFRIWKFRSMQSDPPEQSNAASAPPGGHRLHWRMRKHVSDPRITALGSFLRAWSLDEIPQFLNVLRGEMSLIGPRPIVAEELPLYGDLLHYYMCAKPGLSGLWQVSGRRNLNYAKRVQLDATYVKTWSLFSDIRILCHTIPAVLRRDGSC